MTFEQFWDSYQSGKSHHGDSELMDLIKTVARHSWEAALTYDPAKSHATPVACAQVLENGDLRIRAAGLRMLSDILDGSSVEQPLYLQPTDDRFYLEQSEVALAYAFISFALEAVGAGGDSGELGAKTRMDLNSLAAKLSNRIGGLQND